MVMHGVSLSVGSADPSDDRYLKDLKALVDRVQPAWISDHLCWTGVDRLNLHDLLQMPYSEEAVLHVAERVAHEQDFLGRQILLATESGSATYPGADIPKIDSHAQGA